jgi:hypothetical protein
MSSVATPTSRGCEGPQAFRSLLSAIHSVNIVLQLVKMLFFSEDFDFVLVLVVVLVLEWRS